MGNITKRQKMSILLLIYLGLILFYLLSIVAWQIIPKYRTLRKQKNYYIVVSVGWKTWCSLAGSLSSLRLIGFDGGLGWGYRYLKGELSERIFYAHSCNCSLRSLLAVGRRQFFPQGSLHSLVQTWQLVTLRAGEPRESKKGMHDRSHSLFVT